MKRLKKQLSNHRQAVNALAVASRRLHETLEGLIASADPAHRRSVAKKRHSKGHRRKHSGDGVSARSESERARAAALERHWGNLF